MSRRSYLLLGLVALGIAVAVGVGLRRGDDARLRRAIRRLAGQLEKSGPENALAAASRARELAGFFEMWRMPFIPEHRSDLVTSIFQARALADTISIRLHDLSVEIAPDRETARMLLSATVSVRMRNESDRASRAFEIDWRREPEGWRIEAVRERQTLRRLPSAPSSAGRRRERR